jgi:hypothetical protein
VTTDNLVTAAPPDVLHPTPVNQPQDIVDFEVNTGDIVRFGAHVQG